MSTSGGLSTTSSTDLLALVREVTSAIASAGSLDETLRLIARTTAQSLDAFGCDLYEYAPETRTLIASTSWETEPTPDDEWLGEILKIDDVPEYREALETGLPVEVHIDDPGLDPLLLERMERWGEKSWLLVPLLFGGQPIGVAEVVEQRTSTASDDEEKEIATTLAVPAAIAIHNARLRRRMAEQNRYLALADRVESRHHSTFDLDEVLLRVAREGCEALGPRARPRSTRYDAAQDAIVYRTLYDRVPTPTGPDDPLGIVYARRAPGRARDPALARDRRRARLRPHPPADRAESIRTGGEKTVLSVPLRYRDEPLGILRL
jgi:GAF domain-containing protein